MICDIMPQSAFQISTHRQRVLRRDSRKWALGTAVRNAVEVCFRFKFRALQSQSLWSARERVWMGCDTFLHWSLQLEDIDIPWTVATSIGAPEDLDGLRSAVRIELLAYWAEQLAALPRGDNPHWLPLP
jgi:hypothetical protein